jgi:hypothetical protein
LARLSTRLKIITKLISALCVQNSGGLITCIAGEVATEQRKETRPVTDINTVAFLLSPPTARCFNSSLLNTTHSLTFAVYLHSEPWESGGRAGGLLLTQTQEIAPPTRRCIDCRFINFLNPGGKCIYHLL